MNYDGLPWLERAYKSKKSRKGLPRFSMVIYDESTYEKNIGSERHKISERLLAGIPRSVILTGTVCPNGYLDLYGQMELLVPGMLARTYTTYKTSYFIAPGSGAGKWLPRSGVRDLIAAKMSPYIRVRGAEVLGRAEPTYNVIECELPENRRAQYKELEKQFFLELESGDRVEAFNASSLSMKLRQYVSGFLYSSETGAALPVHETKVTRLKELLEALNGAPLLCAIQFRHEIVMLRRFLGYEVPAIYGDTPGKERERLVAAWNRGELPLLLVNSSSVSHGLNMQDGGCNFLWYSFPWDLEKYDQCTARIDRQGQKEAVIIHSLVIRKTIDEAMQKALERKAGEQSSLIQCLREYKEGIGA
jgi:hypothetical protein